MIYASPSIRVGRDWYVFTSPHVEIRYVFHPSRVVREHANYMLWKVYAKRRTPWWRISEPPIDVEHFTLSPIDQVLGWLLALWMVFKLVK